MAPAVRKLLVLLVLLAVGAYFLATRDAVATDEQGRAMQPGVQLQALDETGLPLASGETPGEGADGAPASPPDDASTVARARPAPSLLVTGRVLSWDEHPVAGVEVLQQHPSLSAGPLACDDDGWFSLLVEQRSGALAIRSDQWLLVGGERVLYEDKQDGYLLVVAPPANWTGAVLDEAGEPLVDVALTAIAPGDALVRFGLVSTPVEQDSQHGWSDAKGAFRIGPAPRVPGATIEATLAGYEPASAPLDDPARPVRIVMKRRRS